MKNPTVLHITPFFSPNVGGVETHLNDLVGQLRKENYNIVVLTYQALMGKVRGARREVQKNLEIIRIPWISNLFYKTAKNPLLHFAYLTPLLLLYTLFFMIKRGHEIDIIHAHGINAAYIGAIIKILFGKPFVISLHVEINLREGSFFTKTLLWPFSKADKVLVLTQSSKEKLEGLGISKERIETYSYWVDQKKFFVRSKESIRSRFGIKRDKFVALFVGRLAEEKGVRLVLEAAKKLPNIDLYIAGGGTLEDEAKNYAHRSKNIHFLGVLANEDLPFYYSLADVLVVPSLVKAPRPTFEEGVPRVIIEALSCGLPVVGTDNGGVKEVIEKANVGIVIESTIESLVTTLAFLKKDTKALNNLKQNCRTYAQERFGEENSRIFLNTYKRLKAKRLLAILLEHSGDMALKRRADWLIEKLDLKDGDKILDVGCGDGYYLYLLSSLEIELQLTGVDSNTKALESAKRNLVGKNIKLVHADLMKHLPFKEGSFDKAIMSEVAEHLPDDTTGLKEVSKTLINKGKLVLSVPSQNYPFFWDPLNKLLESFFNTHIKSGFWAGLWNQHLRLYKPAQIKSVLTKSGFKVKNEQTLTWFCLPFNHHLVNLVARLIHTENRGSVDLDSLNKFKKTEKPFYIKFAFWIVNLLDRPNVITRKDTGVSIVVFAERN